MNAKDDESKTTKDKDEAPRSTKAATKIVYRGTADSFEHGKHIFRPGEPVEVPSEVAEDLLTYPNEKFEESKE